jgi:hypothetical protein
MKTKTLMALAVGAALALPFSTMAEDKSGNAPEGRAAAAFKSLDRDNDGHISKEEITGNQHEMQFITLDQDRDGLLAFHEYMATVGASTSVGSGARDGSAASGSSARAADGHWDQRYRRAHGAASGAASGGSSGGAATGAASGGASGSSNAGGATGGPNSQKD